MTNSTMGIFGSLPFPFGSSTSDEELQAAVLNSLHWHSGVPQDRIKVVVENGCVSLVGTVDKPYERELAQSRVSEVPGVREVNNDIEVKPGR